MVDIISIAPFSVIMHTQTQFLVLSIPGFIFFNNLRTLSSKQWGSDQWDQSVSFKK